MGLKLSESNAYWLGLIDTPDSFTGEALKFVRVRADELKLEFTDGFTIPEGIIIGQTTVWDGNDWILNDDITDDGIDIELQKTDGTFLTLLGLDKNALVATSSEITGPIDRNSYFSISPLVSQMFTEDVVTGTNSYIQTTTEASYMGANDSASSDYSQFYVGYDFTALEVIDGAGLYENTFYAYPNSTGMIFQASRASANEYTQLYLSYHTFMLKRDTGGVTQAHLSGNNLQLEMGYGPNTSLVFRDHYMRAFNLDIADMTTNSLITRDFADLSLFSEFTYLGRTSRLESGVDLDTITESGDYSLGSGLTNGPPDGIFLIVQQQYVAPPPPPYIPRVIQIVHSIFDIFTREQDGTGTWSAWKSMTTPEFISTNAATYTTVLATGGETIIHALYSATGTCIITLDSPSATRAGKVYTIKDAGGDADTYTITIDTQGAETIDGETDAELASNYATITVYSDGSNWFIKN